MENKKGFVAMMRDISLFDYIQLIQMTNKTKTVEITYKEEKAVLQFIKGKIEFAKTSTLTGKKAFFHILTWEYGVLKEISFEKKLKKNITDKSNLLLEAAEYIDKLNLNNTSTTLSEQKKKENTSTTLSEQKKKENTSTMLSDQKKKLREKKLRDEKSEVFKIQL